MPVPVGGLTFAEQVEHVEERVDGRPRLVDAAASQPHTPATTTTRAAGRQRQAM